MITGWANDQIRVQRHLAMGNRKAPLIGQMYKVEKDYHDNIQKVMGGYPPEDLVTADLKNYTLDNAIAF